MWISFSISFKKYTLYDAKAEIMTEKYFKTDAA